MTSGRQMLATALATALPSWMILSDARQLDRLELPGACVLWTQRRTRPEKLSLDLLQDEVTLWVITATDSPALIEDTLDDMLDDVLQALAPLQPFHWSDAERGVLADTFQGWRLTVTCLYNIEGA